MLGILGLVSCQILGIIAWVMANDDLDAMRNGSMDASGYDLTNAGRICGMISVGLLVFQVLIIIVVVLSMGLARP